MVGSHLKRQAGVTDARFRKGTIEVTSSANEGFQIAPLLKSVTEELGFAPVKRIEATIRGRVISGGKAGTLEVAGTGERLPIEGRKVAEGSEQLWRGVIQVRGKGNLTFKPTADQ